MRIPTTIPIFNPNATYAKVPACTEEELVAKLLLAQSQDFRESFCMTSRPSTYVSSSLKKNEKDHAAIASKIALQAAGTRLLKIAQCPSGTRPVPFLL